MITKYKTYSFVFLGFWILTISCLTLGCLRCWILRRRYFRLRDALLRDSPSISSTDSPNQDQVISNVTAETETETVKKDNETSEKVKDTNPKGMFHEDREKILDFIKSSLPQPPIAQDEEVVYCKCQGACNCREDYVRMLSNFLGYEVRNTTMVNYILPAKFTSAYGFSMNPYIRKRKVQTSVM